ncbi:MAG: AAA family ATPase [Clostridia bacterium]|nr:AAA family ATPase [Clostridia bacterium]
MILCSKCNKRVAVVCVTKMEAGKKTNEGFCMKCAREMGFPIDNALGGMMKNFGITPEQMESMEDEIRHMMDESGALTPSETDDDEEGGAPAIDLPKLFGEAAESAIASSEESSPAKPSASGDKKAPRNKKEPTPKKYKFLETYCRNLTRAAKEGALDRIIGRERELARVIQILCRRQKNNPCLIGEPGVGKTAIAEALAQRIAEGQVPYKLRGKEVYLVDLTALVAGTQFRGQFESRMLGLISDVKAAGNVILVIDEVHNIVGTGDSEGSVSAANILKPALSRGEIQVIGATTLNEYRKYIEKDTALERRFQPVMVNEPSVEDSTRMLEGIKHYYESYHHIRIPDEVLARAVMLSERYITDRYLPDKAIDLIDEAAAHLSLSSAVLNESYEIRDQLLKLKTEREYAESEEGRKHVSEQEHYETLAKLKAEEMRLSERLSQIEPECDTIILSSADLADVIEIWTGIPATSINEDEFARLDHLEERLKARIVGQDAAVSAVTRAIKRNRAGISYKRKPVSFIFAGPTGVGKTELVKTLAADLFKSPETLIRLDMSEFMEKHSVSRIIGAPPGYVGYDEAGQLTEKIRRRPYSVVLFDEIEKAHPDVLNILLQILDDGRITDAHGKTVNFENTVIVMTTNAGSDASSSTAGFASAQKDVVESQTMRALSAFLRPEFINRVDEVITFNSLTETNFAAIAEIMLRELQTALAEKEIALTWSENVPAYVGKHSSSHKFGARNMRRYISREIEDPLAEQIIAGYGTKLTAATISLSEDDKLVIRCI